MPSQFKKPTKAEQFEQFLKSKEWRELEEKIDQCENDEDLSAVREIVEKRRSRWINYIVKHVEHAVFQRNAALKLQACGWVIDNNFSVK